MLNRLVKDNKFLRDFDVEKAEKSEIFHSNGAAKVGNKGLGTMSVELTMAERKAIEEKRKLVQKYNNSKIFSSTWGLRHAKKYVPRTEGGANALYGSNLSKNEEGDASGNVRTNYGRTPGNGDDKGGKYQFTDQTNLSRPSSASSYVARPVSKP